MSVLLYGQSDVALCMVYQTYSHNVAACGYACNVNCFTVSCFCDLIAFLCSVTAVRCTV